MKGHVINRFSGKELVGSLFCPALSFVWGLIRFLDAFAHGAEFTGKGLFRMSFFAAMLIGGILSAVLTLAFDIHTECYLDKRLLLIAAVFVFHGIVGRFMISSNMVLLALYMLVSIVAFIVEFTKIRDINTDFGELAVIILSDPVLYWTIYWFVLLIY